MGSRCLLAGLVALAVVPLAAPDAAESLPGHSSPIAGAARDPGSGSPAPPRHARDASYLRAISEVFDAASRAEDPEGRCATSMALDRYLEGLYRQQLSRHARKASADLRQGSSVRMRDGIWIVEADDTMLYHDEPQDLLGRSLRFVPGGSGYVVTVEPLQYDSDLGVLGIQNASQRLYLGISLNDFGFPIGGRTYSTLYAGTDLSVRTGTPQGVSLFSWDQYTVTAAGADLFSDRVDRLSPLFYARGNNWGRYLYVKRTAEKVLITWRTALDPAQSTFHVDVQAALYPNGQILYSYRTLQNVDNGAPLVYAGIQSWINGFENRVTASDPAEGFAPYVDIVQVALEEDPASDMVHLRATMYGAIPASSADRVDYIVTLSQHGAPVYRFRTWVDSRGRDSLWSYPESVGASYIREGPSTIGGASWDVVFSLAKFPDLTTGPLEIQVETYLADALADEATATTSITGGPPFARDYTDQAPFSSAIPIVESFLLPWFIPHGVKDRLLAHTGWEESRIDGMPMYQTFYTDLILWAGAYYTYGNCGAAHIGRCDPLAPPRPGLLHMNKPNYGYNGPGSPSRFMVLSHEFGHHWLQLVNIDEGAGPSNVLNPESPHPAGYVHTEAMADLVSSTDSSVMGGGFWTDNGNGTWSVPAAYTYYSYAAHELYLMGMRDPSEVPDWFYLAGTNPPQPRSYWANPGATVTGGHHLVTIQMLLDAMGTRAPAYPVSKRDLFVPLVLVVRQGQEPSASDWAFMTSVRDPWRSAFSIQTGGRGTVTTLSPREVSPSGSTPLRVEKNGANLRLYFEDPGFGDQVRYNVYQGALGGRFNDWAPSICRATPGTTGAGELFLDVTPPSPGGNFYYLVTMSTVAFEGGPGADSAGMQRATSSSRCGGM